MGADHLGDRRSLDAPGMGGLATTRFLFPIP